MRRFAKPSMRFNTVYQPLLEKLQRLALDHYGQRLNSIVLYGSVARNTARPEPDIDLLVVAEGLPPGRLRRVDDFRPVE